MRYGVPVLTGALVGALVVSDLIGESNAFWRSHQVIAGLASGIVLTLYTAVLGFRHRRGLDPGIEGDYLPLLPEALKDEQTWAGAEGYPGLVEWLAEEHRELRDALKWGAPDGYLRHSGGTWSGESDLTKELLEGLRAHRFAEIRMERLLVNYEKEAGVKEKEARLARA